MIDPVDFDSADPRNLLYARPADHWKIFVSSKMAGGALREERGAAIAAIDAFPLTRAWAWERNAHAGPYSSEHECVAQAGTSDGLVLIVDDDLTDITRKEFEAARAGNAPVFVMLKQGARRSAELQAFIGEARLFAVTVNFATTGELTTQITHALTTWAVRSGRSAMLRMAAPPPSEPDAGVPDPLGAVEIVAEGGVTVSIRDVVSEACEQVRIGRPEDALTTLWELAQSAYDAGWAQAALGLLDTLEDTVDPADIDDEWRGWILNTRGLALSARERHTEATTAFERMRQLGRALGDADLESTALQNLGVQAVLLGRHDDARERLHRSLELKHSIEDWRGAIQVLFNMVNVVLGDENLDAAETLLDELGILMEGLRDPALRTTLNGLRGSLAVAREDFAGAQQHYSAALRAARRSGSVPRMITSMQNLGATAADLGQPARARRWFAKALELAEQIDDLAQRRIQRQALALSMVRIGEPEQAAVLFEQAAAEATELGDATSAAVALADAGACHLQAGDAAGARVRTEQALTMTAATGDDWRAGRLTNLAHALAALGEHEEALQRMLEGANLRLAPEDRAADLRRAGEFATATPNLVRRAPEIFDQELEIRRVHEPSARWAWRAAEIGATLNHTAETARARDFFSRALRVFARRRDRRQVFFIRNDRATSSADLGELGAAAADLRECLAIAKALDDRALLQQAHMNLGEVERRREHNAIAAAHLDTALTLAQALEDLRAEGATRSHLALLAQDVGDADAADLQLAAVERIADALSDSDLRAQAIKGRAHLEFVRGRYGKAANLYARAARLLEDAASVQLVESLAGQVTSLAWRGRLDQHALQRLIDLSWHLGWDKILAESLSGAFAGLARAGAEDDVVQLGVAGMAVAIRSWGGSRSDALDDPLTRTAVRLAVWILADETTAKRRREALEAALVATVGSDLAPTIVWIVDKGIAAVKKNHQGLGSDRDEASDRASRHRPATAPPP